MACRFSRVRVFAGKKRKCLFPKHMAWFESACCPGPPGCRMSKTMVLSLIRTLMAPNLDPRASPGSFFQAGSPGKSHIPPKCRKWVEKIGDFRKNRKKSRKSAEFRKIVRNRRRSFKTGLKNIKIKLFGYVWGPSPWVIQPGSSMLRSSCNSREPRRILSPGRPNHEHDLFVFATLERRVFWVKSTAKGPGR